MKQLFLILSVILGSELLAGDVGYLQKDKNLSDVNAATSAVTNLGFTSTAAEISNVAGLLYGSDKGLKVASVAVTAGTVPFSWANPVSGTIVVEKVTLNITTAGSYANAALDVGVSATAAGTGENLMDNVYASAVGFFDTVTNRGTAGKSSASVPSGYYVTASTVASISTGLAGYAYILYHAL